MLLITASTCKLLCRKICILYYMFILYFNHQVAYTLGCVVLSNTDNQEKLHDQPGFKFDILLDLLCTGDEVSDNRCFNPLN